MKTVPRILLVVAFSYTSCQQPSVKHDCPEPPLAEIFTGSITFDEIDEAPMYEKLTYIDGSFDLFAASVIDKILEGSKAGDLKIYDRIIEPTALDAEWELTQTEVRQQLVYVDTVYIEVEGKMKMNVVSDSAKSSDIHSIRLNERWFLNDSLKLTRSILSYTPVKKFIDPITGEVRGLQPLFHVKCSDEKVKSQKIATIRNTQYIARGTDGGANWYAENLEHSVRQKFFGSLLERVFDGSLKVYEEPNSVEPMDSLDLNRRMTRVDSLYIESPKPPYEMKMVVVEESIGNWEDVVAIELVQDVYVDDNLGISVDVKSYAPIFANRDYATGEVLGKTPPIFWVKN